MSDEQPAQRDTTEHATSGTQRLHLNRRMLEVFVVAVVVLLVASVLIPSFVAAREAARTSNSLNNLKQFGLA